MSWFQGMSSLQGWYTCTVQSCSMINELFISNHQPNFATKYMACFPPHVFPFTRGSKLFFSISFDTCTLNSEVKVWLCVAEYHFPYNIKTKIESKFFPKIFVCKAKDCLNIIKLRGSKFKDLKKSGFHSNLLANYRLKWYKHTSVLSRISSQRHPCISDEPPLQAD